MPTQELPDLRIVPTEALVLHEDADPRRVERLTARLRDDGIIKNPPVVAPLDAARFVVLDGANRVSALRALGIPHALAQVVSYTDVELDTWHHLITGVDRERLFAAVRGVPGVRLTATTLDAARESLAERVSLAYLVCPSGDVYSIENGHSLDQGAHILVAISNIYRGVANIYRVKTDHIDTLADLYDNVAALVVYPAFTPSDIVALASNHAKVPTGITRHVIPGRALRVNLPLAVLRADESVAAKNEWLGRWLRERLAAKAVRFYAESTYLFDE